LAAVVFRPGIAKGSFTSIVWKNPQNDRSRKFRFHAPNLILHGNRHDKGAWEGHTRQDYPRGRTPAEFSFKVVYCRLNCDRREKSSFPHNPSIRDIESLRRSSLWAESGPSSSRSEGTKRKVLPH
jgi:hypothetical protein